MRILGHLPKGFTPQKLVRLRGKLTADEDSKAKFVHLQVLLFQEKLANDPPQAYFSNSEKAPPLTGLLYLLECSEETGVGRCPIVCFSPLIMLARK